MTEKRIDQLDAIGAITGDDLVPMWDSGSSATKHVTAANARTYMAAESAPIDATYVTLSTNATLTGERVLTAGTGITLTDAGAGSTITAATTALLPTLADAKGDLLVASAEAVRLSQSVTAQSIRTLGAVAAPVIPADLVASTTVGVSARAILTVNVHPDEKSRMAPSRSFHVTGNAGSSWSLR